jgi:Tol biopolymer transport system component
MIVDVATKSTETIADGWFPSWSPDGNKLAYVALNGSRCYTVDLRHRQRRLLWWSLRTLFTEDIIGPAIWAPSGGGALFNVTSGMKGDSRVGYYVDFASGKTRRVWYDSAFEVVGWLGHGSQDTAEPKPNR